MIDIYLKPDGDKLENVDLTTLSKEKIDSILWVDIYMPSEKEEQDINELLNVKLISKEDAGEIESTSKYCETKDGIVANINFYEEKADDFKVEPISFIMTNDKTLITIRHTDCEVFTETARRILVDENENLSGQDIFMTIIEAHIDEEADIVELVASTISKLSSQITKEENVGKDTIKDISVLQSKIITFRENIFDLQRVLFSIRRSPRFSSDIQPRLQLMLQDVDSLINHADFSFQRLDSVQDTALGLINIEQNDIMKILSVAAVVFMPPTLLASIYGMNFKYMPELDWAYTTQSGAVIPLGYISALFLMLVVAGFTVWFCKHKNWL